MKTMYSAASSAMNNTKFISHNIKESGEESLAWKKAVGIVSDESEAAEFSEMFQDRINEVIKKIPDPQERMEFHRKGLKESQIEARKNNEEAVAEIISIIDEIESLFLDSETATEFDIQYDQESLKETKDMLQNYTGDSTVLLEQVAAKWQKENPFWNNNDYINNRLYGNELIKDFKKYIASLASMPKEDQLPSKLFLLIKYELNEILKEEKGIEE